jgi:hypothetical protein
VSADRPATVGRVVCDTDGEEGVLTVWAAAPQVEAGGAA